MKIYLGADHAGFDLKEKVQEHLEAAGHEVLDLGDTVYEKSDDYPDYVGLVAEAVVKAPEESRGIIFGWSGQGEAIVANRYKGVRAALYTGGGDEVITLSREHNNSNVLSLGAHFVSPEDAFRLIKLWLDTPFSGDPRHENRIEKIDQHFA